jgi:hypothetical protein
MRNRVGNAERSENLITGGDDIGVPAELFVVEARED